MLCTLTAAKLLLEYTIWIVDVYPLAFSNKQTSSLQHLAHTSVDQRNTKASDAVIVKRKDAILCRNCNMRYKKVLDVQARFVDFQCIMRLERCIITTKMMTFDVFYVPAKLAFWACLFSLIATFLLLAVDRWAFLVYNCSLERYSWAKWPQQHPCAESQSCHSHQTAAAVI